MPPLVSIVTPTLNQGCFLADAMQSVAMQDHDDVEYVVVNGGTDPETDAVVSQFSEVVTHYIREPDSGQSDAINKGFRLARGEIVAWLNADDCYLPTAVSHVVRVFAENPEVDVVYGDAVYVDQDGQFLRYFTEIEPPDAKRLRNDAAYICQPATFFRKRALERAGYLDSCLQYTMDWDLWIRMVKAGCRFLYSPQLLAANREHARTKTISGGSRRLREILTVNARHKTSLLPRVFFAFALASLTARRPWTEIWLRPLRATKRRLYGRRQIPALYGLHHHSRAAERMVDLTLPLVRPAVAAEVAVDLPPGLPSQRVVAHLAGQPAGELMLSESAPAAALTLSLAGLNGASQLDIRLVAEQSHQVDGREVCFLLRGMRVRYASPAGGSHDAGA